MMKLSHSRIQTFKACRRLYELQYRYGLFPIKETDALKRGTNYHEAVEACLSGRAPEACDNPKVNAMVKAFQRHLLPKLPKINPEQWFERKTRGGDVIIGRLDGITEDNVIVEHKTVSGTIPGNYLMMIPQNEQLLTYLWANDSQKAIYTVCGTPLLRPMKSETEAEFEDRCEHWFDDCEQKITALDLFVPKEEIDAHAEALDDICGEIKNCKTFYRNQTHCMKYGTLCPYYSICYDNVKDDVDYVGFERRQVE